MAGSWTSETFPRFEEAIRRLTEQHLELVDEPLHLAMSYLPAGRDPQDIYLLEVIGSPRGRISPERDLFEVTFEVTPEFPTDFDQRLHLILTNPTEFGVALEQGWPLANEVVNAILDGDYQILHEDEIGTKILAGLREETRRREAVRG